MAEMQVEQKTGAENVFWDLSSLYSGHDDPQIDKDIEAISVQVSQFVSDYRGRIGELVAEELGEAMASMESINEGLLKLGTYAYLNFSVYATDPKWGALMQKINEAGAKLGQEMVFTTLEWNAIEDEKAKALLAEPVLRNYAYSLETDRQNKPYLLSEAEEKLLIEKSLTGGTAWVRFFDQLTGAMTAHYNDEDVPFEQVLSVHANHKEREERKKAADAITAALTDKSMEFSYIFNVLLADKASEDRMRGYPSWISERNMGNKASDETVEALIASVTSHYSLVAEHYTLKKKLMGYDELYNYDRYAPLNLKESDSFYTWESAKKIVLDAYRGFNPEMGAIAKRFFDENWIHAPVLPGKTGGAYAYPSGRDTNPWIFLNYTGTANDVMTLAHEMGHGIHQFLSAKAQSYFNRYTPITTSETASVFGEMIVFQDLMKKENDKEVQLAMLVEKVDATIATVFRQISLNRFEDAIHTARRTEGELSTDRLNELWMQTQEAMFEGSVTMLEDYKVWWMYVSHFLASPGYVYGYAFGELLVFALYNLYEQTGADFIPKYVQLLSDGDSDYPEKLLAKVGVDLSDPEFWNKGIALIQKLVDQETALAKELYPEKF